MRKRRHLRMELTRGSVLATTLTLVIFMAGTLIHLRYGMNNTVDQQLLDIGPDILNQLDEREDSLAGESLPVFLTLFDERNLIRLLEAGRSDGTQFFRNPRYLELLDEYRQERLEDESDNRPPDNLQTIWHDGRNWRVAYFSRGTMTVILAADLGGMEKPLLQMLIAFIFALPIAAATAAIVSLWQARRISTPIEYLAQHARELTATQLNRRVELGDASSEVYELSEALNRMTDRLSRSFSQARRFSADASHELKSPLTVMQGILENHLHGENEATIPHEEALRLLEATTRLKAIVEGLLILAKADEGSLLQKTEHLSVRELLEAVAQDAAALAEEAGARFETDLPENGTIKGDEHLLMVCLHNLLSNAIRHCPAGGLVRLTEKEQQGTLQICVFNEGAPIPNTELERIFERFVRLQPSYQGLGLGLNIAREIARAHDGDLQIQFSDARGTQFILTLPAPESFISG
jgi:signal transduction histidine kinase